MGEVRFQREALEQVRGDQLTRLLESHYLEVAHFKDIPLDIDWPAYELLERNRALRVFTARSSGHLVGYGAFIVRNNPHYFTSLQSVQDVLFLTPEMRGQLIGYRFMGWCDRQLKAEGVQAGYQHSKIAHPMDAVLERLGYAPVDTLWVKRFDLWAPRQQ